MKFGIPGLALLLVLSDFSTLTQTQQPVEDFKPSSLNQPVFLE